MSIETVLIVDDEESVRRTVVEWLQESDLNCRLVVASDAESALRIANEQSIDLAVLDWNLGAGSEGLQLLEDLVDFQPDIIAILMTGHAQQATPLEALRKGVRDYLDKGIDFHRKTFLDAVRRQLEKIRPAKRQREFHRGLTAFRDAVEKILPLVRSSAALNDPVPLPDAIRSLFRFLLRGTGATGGVLIVRSMVGDGAESIQAYDVDGTVLPTPPVPFAQSLAASVVSMQQPCLLRDPDRELDGTITWQPFEMGRRSILAAPVTVANGVHAILELFDKEGAEEFDEDDRRLIAAASDFGVELLRSALAERQTQRLLFDAVDVALRTGEQLAAGMTADLRPEAPPPADVLDQLRLGLDASSNNVMSGGMSIRLAEAIRVLALRHGSEAVQHCIELVESLRRLLDRLTGGES